MWVPTLSFYIFGWTLFSPSLHHSLRSLYGLPSLTATDFYCYQHHPGNEALLWGCRSGQKVPLVSTGARRELAGRGRTPEAKCHKLHCSHWGQQFSSKNTLICCVPSAKYPEFWDGCFNNLARLVIAFWGEKMYWGACFTIWKSHLCIVNYMVIYLKGLPATQAKPIAAV